MTNRTKKFKNISEQIIELVDEWHEKLKNLYNEPLSDQINSKDWTIKEIIGHLVDSASNNHQRIVRLQYNPVLEFPDYRQHNEEWIQVQNYQETNWEDLLDLWKFYNYHLVHIFKNIDTDTLDHTWTDYKGTKISLDELVTSYLFHVNLHLGEVEELLDIGRNQKTIE